MGFALILIDGLLLLPAFGAAQEPSFDCAKAEAPALNLVCADPELRRLSGLLGQAYAQKLNAADESERNRLKSEQKAWIAARNQRCGLPPKGPELDIEQLWGAAPCLADTYRERLAVLGSLERPAGAPPVSTTSRFIHPSCIEAALDEGARPISIAACNRASRHIPVDLKSGELSAPGGCCGLGFGYALVGTLADGREVALVSDQTGTGAFGERRSIVVLDRTRDPAETLLAEMVVEGTSHCFGAVVDAHISDRGIMEFTTTASPGSLLAAVDPDHDFSDLPDFANSCVGTLTYRYDASNDATELISGSIEPDWLSDLSEPTEEGRYNCFLDLVHRLLRGTPSSLSIDQLRALAADVRKTCSGT